MGMSTGAKVAIGCGIVAVLGAFVLAVTLGVGAFWLKGKAEEMTGGLEGMTAKAEEIESWTEKANANSYTAPADGVIPEARLVKFLDVRKAVHSVYEQHQAEIEGFAARTKDKEDLSVSETLEGAGKLASLAGDVRLAQMKALAGAGMNEEEYQAIQMAVYQSAWASEIEKETGQMPADAMRENMEAAARAMEEARESGAPGTEALSSDEMAEAMKQTAELTQQGVGALDVPRSNVELFRKYRADIEKYAMHGLAFLGL
jgi:hypothetical protein